MTNLVDPADDIKTKINKLAAKGDQMCKKFGKQVPTILPKTDNIIVLGDIHGDLQLAIDILVFAQVARMQDGKLTWIGGNTHVVQVGDQVDRCRHPKSVPVYDSQRSYCNKEKTATYKDEPHDIAVMELFNDLHRQAIKYGGAVISLLGNHEINNSMGDMNYVSYAGIKQFNNYVDPITGKSFADGFLGRKHAFHPGGEYGIMMGCTRVATVIIGSNLFMHAGIVDKLLKYYNISTRADLDTIRQAVKLWLLGLLVDENYVENIIDSSKKSFFWGRILGTLPSGLHVDDKRCVDNIGKVVEVLQIGHIIIGHTPQYIQNDQQGINKTCNDIIWRVDTGSSNAFHFFDRAELSNNKKSSGRKIQYLKIVDDNIFEIHRQ